MRIASSLCLTTVLLWSGAAAAHGPSPHAAAGNAPPPTVAEVMTQRLPEYPGKEALMITVEYPPGGADPVHRHDAHAFVYVLEGAIVMGVAGGKEVTLKAGQSFHEGPADLHTIGRNASQTEPAKFLVLLLKDIDKPALIPVP
ncbi:cupin domain-containing protein [Lysobacter silvisoli]|uniref:Cupin domain-containing protein n=1 Tax=Lysobacter silvisoli TaxID=2293254 RepID=A0A371K056_9GAMM|nr:cupin domain-containing protein [Lysobacter silvisoli]RDZ27305.1 cupin domain-containing protein [Lysobacter silvisoli]